MLTQLPDKKHQVKINGEAWTAPTAIIIGKVTIDAHSSIGHNSVLRGDPEKITIGNLTNVQEDCLIETKFSYGVSIGNRVSIGYDTRLTGCTIQDGVVIGDRSIIMEGARIGAESVIKPGTLVYSNMQIPPKSLVAGIPGRVIKQLSEEEIQHQNKYWQHVENFLDSRLNDLEKQTAFGSVAI